MPTDIEAQEEFSRVKTQVFLSLSQVEKNRIYEIKEKWIAYDSNGMQSTFLFYSDRICLISRLLCFQKAAWKTSLCTVYPPFRELKRNAL